MRSIQTNPMIFMSDRLSVAFSFSRRAHLLTTCKAGGGIPPVGRARALFTNCPPDTSPERQGVSNSVTPCVFVQGVTETMTPLQTLCSHSDDE